MTCLKPGSITLTVLSKQRWFLSSADRCFFIFWSAAWQDDTKSRACPDSVCNHTEQSAESCVKTLWGAIWAISKQHLPQPCKGGGCFPQRSWAHFEHIIVLFFPLQPHYRTIWLQGGNKGRRWKISSSVDEVDAGPRAGLLPLSCLTRVWLQGCSGKVQLYKNTVCVHSRWNCMSHTFGHRGGEA